MKQYIIYNNVGRSFLIFILLLALRSAVGEDRIAAQPRYRTVALGREHPTWTSRLTWWTNLSDWALASPNVGFEIDLLQPSRMRGQSLSLQFRDGADSQFRLWRNDFADGAHLDVFGLRLDYRWHFSPYRHPEHYRGRYFAGPSVQLINRTQYASVGAVGGYDFPAFSFGNRHFLEFQVSGLMAGCREGLFGELHFGMALRPMSISAKYWQPDERPFLRNQAQNRIAHQQLDSLQTVLELDPVILSVPSLWGDSTLSRPVTISEVRNAFARRINNPYLLPEHLEEMPDHTPLPITEPSEFCNIRYRLITRPEDYDGTSGETPYIFPFRVRIQGYDWAIARQRSYNESLRAAFQRAERQLPSLYLPPVSRDSMSVSATVEQVRELLSAQWDEDQLVSDEIVDFYYRQDGEFVPVSQEQLCRRGTYAVGLRFHPQVTEAYDSLPTRFNILPLIDERDRSMSDHFLSAYHGQPIYIEHPWLNGQEQDVTVRDVISALADAGFPGYTAEQLLVPDTIRYGRSVVTASYGPVLQPMQFLIAVEDSLAIRQGAQLYEALADGVDARRATWSPRYGGNDAHGPLVEGAYDDDGQLVAADRVALREAVVDYLSNINPALRALRIDDTWVEDYQYTGLHNLGQRRPSDPVTEMWTILQFRYRMLHADGHTRTVTTHVAYRIRLPQSSQ